MVSKRLNNKLGSRFSVPAADAFMMGIMDDEMDIDMAQSKEDENYAIQSRASKTWRVLRLSSRNKLAAFDRIEDGKNLKVLFETPSPTTTVSAEQQQQQQSSDKTAPGTITTTQPLPSAESQAPTDEITKENGADEQDHESSTGQVEKDDAAKTAVEHTSAESQHPEEALATADNEAS